jgi:hypothetical protein
MARRKRKRGMFRGAVLLGAAGGAAALARKLTGGGDEPQQSHSDAARPTGQEERPPATASPPKSPTATGEGTGSVTTASAESLATAEPEKLTPAPGTSEVVKPDDSAGDPLVDEQTKKAEAEAGSVGGNVQELAESEPGFPSDPEVRPVVEGSGDDPETAEQADAELGGNRETRP